MVCVETNTFFLSTKNPCSIFACIIFFFFLCKMLFKIVLDGVQLVVHQDFLELFHVSYPRYTFWRGLLQRLLVIACFMSKYLQFLSAFGDVSLKPPVDVRDDLIINEQTAS